MPCLAGSGGFEIRTGKFTRGGGLQRKRTATSGPCYECGRTDDHRYRDRTGTETWLGTETGGGNGDDAGGKERAQHAASTAADEGKHVAGVVAEEAKSVAGEAKDHARNLVSEARSQLQGQVDDQSRQQKDMLVGTLSTFGDDLASMAQNGSGLAADVAHQVAERASSLSRHLDGREPSELLDDVRRFARQRPGTFLLGALAAGVIVDRLARGTKDAIDAAEGTQDTRPTTHRG